MDVRTYRFYINAILSPLGVIFNCIGLLVIKTFTGKNLKSYQKVMYLGASTDVLYALTMFIFAPTNTIAGGFYLLIVDSVFGHFSEPFISKGNAVCVFASYFCISTIPIQFVYRFLAICFKKDFDWLTFLALTSISFIACGFYTWQVLSVPIETPNAITDNVTRQIGWADPITGNLPPYAAAKLVNVLNIATFGYVMIIVSYVLIIVCSLAVYFKFKKDLRKMQSVDLKTQRQISLVLLVEAGMPFITICIPILMDLISTTFSLVFYWLGPTRKIIACLHPFINPLLKGMIIGDYRNGMFNFVGFDPNNCRILKIKN